MSLMVWSQPMESVRISAASSLINSSCWSGQILPTRGQKISKSWSLNHFWDFWSSGIALRMIARLSPAV